MCSSDLDDRDRPAGWSHGKKTGWGDCDLPPGQAKKHGCHSAQASHHDRDHDYARDRREREAREHNARLSRERREHEARVARERREREERERRARAEARERDRDRARAGVLHPAVDPVPPAQHTGAPKTTATKKAVVDRRFSVQKAPKPVANPN